MNKVLIWLGAGQAETPSINFDKFETVVLVEARLEQVTKLRKQFSKDKKFKIVHGVISNTAQKSDFNRYSLGEFSAFSSATGLKELYPGLKLEEREEVNTQIIVDVLEEYITQPASITLVLDILDINHLILESLFSTDFWQNINSLYLPFPEFSLYENALPAPELLSLLQSQGFELNTTDILDPDIPVAEMHRNPMWSELELVKKQLQLQKGQHQKEIDEYKSQLQAQNNDAEKAKLDFTQSLEKQSVELKKVVETKNKLKSELEESDQQRTDLVKSLEKRLKSDKLASEATIKQLQTDKQQLIETHGKDKEENEQQYQKLFSQIQTLTAQVEQKTTKIEHLQSSLETQKAESTKQFETLQAEKQQVASNLEQLKISFSTLELEHKQQLEESSQAKQSFQSVKSSLKFELASLKTKLEKRTKQRDEQAHWHQENKKWAEGLNKKVESLEVSLKASNERLKTVLTEKQQLETEVDELNAKLSVLETAHKQQLDDSLQVKQSLQSEKRAIESELSSLIAELEKRTKQRDEQANWHQENKKWAEGLKKKVESLEVSLKASNESLKTVQTEKQQLETKVDELNTKLSVLETEHKQHFDDSLQVKQSLQSEKSAIESELSSLKAELEERTKQRDEQAHWHEENKKWAEGLSVKCEDLKNTVNEREKNTALAIKLQTKAQLDLDDLRKKYQLKHSREQELVELIKELRQKLQQAAEFYHFLQDKHPEVAELEFTSNNQTISAEKSCLDSDSES